MTHSKTCPICGKIFVCFNKKRIYCSDRCNSRNKRLKYPEKEKARHRRWYQNNREKILLIHKRYNDSHGEQRKVWYIKNKERISQLRKKYREKNREFLKKYREENREKWREKRQRDEDYFKKNFMTMKPSCCFINKGYEICLFKSYRIPKHRWVMMRKLGRLLKKWEFVHHLNQNKLDNRIKNLQVIPYLHISDNHKDVILALLKKENYQLKQEVIKLKKQLNMSI